MFRKPRWSVTWPTRPNGVYIQLVRANDPTDAVRVAAEQDVSANDDYSVAFDYEPEVWRLQRPYRWRSHHAAGPDYSATDGVVEACGALPTHLDEVADQVVSAVRAGDALGHAPGQTGAAVGQIVGWMRRVDVEAVLIRVAAEAKKVNQFTSGETPQSDPVPADSSMPMEPEYYLGWAALSVNRMAEMERDGITPTADNRKAHELYMDAAHRAGVTDAQISDFAQSRLQGRTV